MTCPKPLMRFAQNISLTYPARVQFRNRSQLFLESDNYEDAVRKAVSLGGDADTMSCIAGEIAEAFYGPIPEDISLEARKRLPNEFLKIIDEFYEVIRE